MDCVRGLIVAVVCAFTFGSSANAADWTYTLSPYGWGAGIDGSVSVGELSTDVEVGFDDILDNMDWGVLAAFEAHNGDSFILVDAVYITLNANSQVGPASAKVGLDELIVTAVYGVQVNDTPFAIFGGARYLSIDTSIRDRSGLGLSASKDIDMVDPILGGRMTLPVNDRAGFVVTGDVGGFGAGTDFTWEVIATVYTKITDSIVGAVGYRAMNFDHDDDGVEMDLTMHGFLAGVHIVW